MSHFQYINLIDSLNIPSSKAIQNIQARGQVEPMQIAKLHDPT
jgi:hypothetical protein